MSKSLQSLQIYPTFSTVSLHELVRAVQKSYECWGTYTCHIAGAVLRENGIEFGHIVWAKLLEESFPGCAYKLVTSECYEWSWKYCVTLSLAEMEFSHNGINCQNFLEDLWPGDKRQALFAKLLAQPDRTLVIPHSLASLA